MEGVIHSIDSNSSTDHRSSSVNSLQNYMPSSKVASATSYPHLRQMITDVDTILNNETTIVPATSNSLLPSSAGKNRHLNASLCRLDNLYSRRTSIPVNRAKEDRLPYFRQKSLDESTISTPLSKGTETTLGEKRDLNEKTADPIEVRVRCIFSRVGEIDTLNERYTAEIFFEASWYDQKIQPGCQYDPQMGHFNPQLVVLNHIGDTLRHEVSGENVVRYLKFFDPLII